MNTLPEKQCDRCGVGTEFYVNVCRDTKDIVICSDCCMSFISFVLDCRIIKPTEVIDYVENTRP